MMIITQGQTFVNRSLFKSHPHYISDKCRFCTSYAANSKDILKHFELFYSHSDKFILVIKERPTSICTFHLQSTESANMIFFGVYLVKGK